MGERSGSEGVTIGKNGGRDQRGKRPQDRQEEEQVTLGKNGGRDQRGKKKELNVTIQNKR